MTLEACRAFARPFPERVLLLSTGGEILASAPLVTALGEYDADEWSGSAFTILATTSSPSATRYLRACSRINPLMLGASTLQATVTRLGICRRCEEARPVSFSATDEVRLLLRLPLMAAASQRFL